MTKTDPGKPKCAYLTGRGHNVGADDPGTIAVRRRVVGWRLDVVVYRVVKEEVVIVLLLVWKDMVFFQ